MLPVSLALLAALLFATALGFSLSFLLQKHWDRDESGSHTATITGHGLGYWLWIASMVTALVGSLFAGRIARNRETALRSIS